MGIKVTSGFDLNAPQLLDSKSKQASLADMDALVKNNEVVEGQLCYCTADSKLYILKNGTWSVVVVGEVTNDKITGFGGNQTINSTTYTQNTLSVRPYYNSNGPSTYGNILEIVSHNNGGGQLALEWTGGQTKTDGTDTSVGSLFYRSKRDCVAGWSK